MNLRRLVISLILILTAAGCREKITPPPEVYINLSELVTKTDYYLPFAIRNDADNIRQTILNDKPVEFTMGSFIEFGDNGFYELILIHSGLQADRDTFLFTTKTEEREASEWGIRAWTPAPFTTTSLGPENIELYYPKRFTDRIKVPFIFYVRESGELKAVYCRGKHTASGATFNIKRGVGSIDIDAASLAREVNFTVGGKKVSASVTKIDDPYIDLFGTISSETVIPANSLVRVTGNLTIASTGSLTVNEGVVFLVDEAVDINLSGPVKFSGTASNPVFVTCTRGDRYWGGFITKVSAGTVEAHYTIFCRSGYHDSDDYAWGHAGRQALFYTGNSTLTLDHCFMLDHIGQIFYPKYSTITLDNIVVQRAKTGGQVNQSDLTIRNSVFTDFPDDSYTFTDNDNDALYLIETDAVIDNTLFMFAKDDGLDSGGEEGGTVAVTGCRFEACFHEGAALSSAGPVVKNHSFTRCVFANCGQGIELGFSSPNHTVTADSCSFLNNGIGIRYGDNYSWSGIYGKMNITNSSSMNNDRDVWNMVRKNWTPKINNMTFENTVVSKFCPQYPDLEIMPGR